MTLPVGEALRRLPEALLAAWNGLWENDAGVYASSIAFHSLSSVFAISFLLSTISNTLGGDAAVFDFLVGYVSELVPAEVMQTVYTAGETVTRPVNPALLPIAMVLTLWMATNVFQAIIHALHRSYHMTETRAFWRTRLFALGYMGAGFVLILSAVSLLTVGGAVDRLFPEWSAPRSGFLEILVHFRKEISFVILALGTFLIYWLAPKFRGKPRIALPGTIAFTVLWLIATTGFNIYLQRFAVYDQVYGPLATVVVTLTWVNLSAYLLLYGGELNAAYARMLENGDGEPSP